MKASKFGEQMKILKLLPICLLAFSLFNCGGSKAAADTSSEPVKEETLAETKDKALAIEKENHELRKKVFELNGKLEMEKDN